MAGKIDSSGSYTAIREQFYRAAADKSEKTALRFEGAKGLYAKDGISNIFGNRQVRNAKYRDAINIVRNAIDLEFNHRTIDGRPVGQFIMDRMGKLNPGQKLTIKDLRQIDSMLEEMLQQDTVGNKAKGLDDKARIAAHAQSMLNDAKGGKSTVANSQLQFWQSRTTGYERMRSAVMQDLKLANKIKYAINEQVLGGDADKFMKDAGVKPSYGLNPANIERVRARFEAEYDFDAPSVSRLHDVVTMRVKVSHSAPELSRAVQKIRNAADKFPVQMTIGNSLRTLCANTQLAADQMRAFAKINGLADDKTAARLYSDLATVANEAQRLANKLPRNRDDVALRLEKQQDQGGNQPKSFNALPLGQQQRYEDLINLRQELENHANACHDLAMSLVPRDQRPAATRPRFFTGKSLRQDSHLTENTIRELSRNIKIPDGVYSKTGSGKRPADMSPGSANAMVKTTIRTLTKTYNEAAWKTQLALHEYKKNPDSIANLNRLADAAEQASADADRLLFKLDGLRNRVKGDADADLARPTFRLRSHRKALNDIRRKAALEIGQARAGIQKDIEPVKQLNVAKINLIDADSTSSIDSTSPIFDELERLGLAIDQISGKYDSELPDSLREIARYLCAGKSGHDVDLDSLLEDIRNAIEDANDAALQAANDNDKETEKEAKDVAYLLRAAENRVTDEIDRSANADDDSLLDDDSIDSEAGDGSEIESEIREILRDINTPTGSDDEIDMESLLASDDRVVTLGKDSISETDLDVGDVDEQAWNVDLTLGQISDLQKNLNGINDLAQSHGIDVDSLTLSLGQLISTGRGDLNELSATAAGTLLKVGGNDAMRAEIQALQANIEACMGDD